MGPSVFYPKDKTALSFCKEKWYHIDKIFTAQNRKDAIK